MRKKGFTLVELLVVISIIAMLMGILMPALARVRFLAQRVVCGTHLSGIGKAIMTYANDYEGKYPRAGGKKSYWGPTLNWDPPLPNPGEREAFGYDPDNGVGATIGSCLFLLVKYADAGTKIFVCSGDTGATKLELADYANEVPRQDVTEAWDFGGNTIVPDGPPGMHCSYSYHVPFGQIGTAYFPLTTLGDAGMAMMADRSPYLVLSPDPQRRPFMFPPPTKEQLRYGNSMSHRSEGQNVLFNDSHVSWEEEPYCGVDDDNIYTIIDTQDRNNPKECGLHPPDVFDTTFLPQTRIDSALINEGGPQGAAIF